MGIGKIGAGRGEGFPPSFVSLGDYTTTGMLCEYLRPFSTTIAVKYSKGRLFRARLRLILGLNSTPCFKLCVSARLFTLRL